VDIVDGGGMTIDTLGGRVEGKGMFNPDDGMIDAGDLVMDEGAGGELDWDVLDAWPISGIKKGREWRWATRGWRLA